MNQNIKKDYIWNTIASVAYSSVSVLIGIVVIRIVGKIEGGLFTFGFTTLAQQVYSIAYFGVKAFQVVDSNRKFSFKTYKLHRKITTFFALLFGLIYIFSLYKMGTYSIEKSIILFFIIFHGIFEGYFEVYDSEYQRVNKLYIAGIALLIRTVAWTLVLIFILIITKNLLFSVILGMITKFIMGYIFEVWYSKKYFVDESNIKEDYLIALKDLTIAVLPIFFTCFLDNYIYVASKYAIDMYLGDTFSGYFSFLFLPASLIYMIDYMIIRPFLTPLGKAYIDDRNEFERISKNIVLITAIICAIYLLLVTIFSGVYMYVINIITNQIYLDMEDEFFMILLINTLAGCAYVIGCPFYYFIIVENKQNILAIYYGIVGITAFILGHLIVPRYGLIGASFVFLISMIMLGVGLLILHMFYYKKHLSKDNK